MKKIIQFTCLLFLCVCTNAYSQTSFAPPGADWYNTNYTGGAFHCYYDGDSVILGITTSIIRQKAIVPSSSWVSDRQTLYTYTSGDTVFAYHRKFGGFTPLYIFNVNDGDTVCIPGFEPPDGTMYDTSFCFVVDSVRMVLYDTALLKTVYTRTIIDPGAGSETHSTYGNEATGTYVERIGGVTRGIYPQCTGFCVVIPEDCGCIGPLRCYSDATMSIKLVTGLCQPFLAIDEAKTITAVRAYPIPANDHINVVAPPNCTIRLMATDGRTILAVSPSDSNESVINTTTVPNGIYIINTSDGNTVNDYKRIEIFH